MFKQGQVEEMLRAHPAPYGSIQLFKGPDDERWSAMVSHYDLRSVAPPATVEVTDVDPVVALGKALIQDERLLRDTERKYAAATGQTAPPAPPQQIDIEEAIAAVAANDMMDLIG